ncbi:MAG: flagellar biosynthesis protein FlgA [Proteobacteria bacterium]|nr:flagellar biosynthesis protein FlgA [Pseudomonadota bacterium]
MNPAALLAGLGERRVRAGLVGAGEFGASFLYRARVVKQLVVPAVAERDPARARAACLAAGLTESDFVLCDSRATALAAIEGGRTAIVPDAALLAELPLDVLVEATGHPEAGARSASLAIAAGMDVAMVSKEAHSVIGPVLQRRARAAGRVCTPVDGDQPSLLAGLVTWARALGLEVVCGGKASEYDFVFDPARGTLAALGQTFEVPDLAAHWSGAAAGTLARVAARAGWLAHLPHRTAPDLCELGIVANATGLKPDVPRLHAPIARTLELPELMRPEGGLLSRSGVLDIFNCYRRPDELSFAGGVFVIVACDDAASWQVIGAKGVPVSADGRYALVHNPVHLLGLEAPYTILGAALLRRASTEERPVCDLVARAERDLPAGTAFALGARHTLPGLEAELADAGPLDDARPVPFYMAAGQRLARAVRAGALLTVGDMQRPVDSVLWTLRAEQDAAFFGAVR